MNSACWRSAAVAAEDRRAHAARRRGAPARRFPKCGRPATPRDHPGPDGPRARRDLITVSGLSVAPRAARGPLRFVRRDHRRARARPSAAASRPPLGKGRQQCIGVPISAVISTTPRPAACASFIAATPGPATGVSLSAARKSCGEQEFGKARHPHFPAAAPASRRRTRRGRSGRTSPRFWRTSAGQPLSGETTKRTAAPISRRRVASGRPSPRIDHAQQKAFGQPVRPGFRRCRSGRRYRTRGSTSPLARPRGQRSAIRPRRSRIFRPPPRGSRIAATTEVIAASHSGSATAPFSPASARILSAMRCEMLARMNSAVCGVLALCARKRG